MHDKVVVVTGGASGIGEAMVKRFCTGGQFPVEGGTVSEHPRMF